MTFVHLFQKRHRQGIPLSKAISVCVLISLLAGLLPPSFGSILPILEPQTVQAATDAPHIEAQTPVVAATTLLEPALAQDSSAVKAVAAAPVAAANASPLPQSGPASISGLVYDDKNFNGVKDAAEGGVGGVTVTAYDASGAALTSSVASTTPATLGQYTLSNLPASTPMRLEFTTLSAGYRPAAHSSSNGTSVQFVTTTGGSTTNVNFGVNIPADYSQANPDLATSIYYNGDADATAPTNTLVKFPYNSSGTTAPTTLATKAQIGSTWGLAYARSTKILYAAAFLKRHVGLGPNGLGAIYRVPTSGGAPTLFADLATLGANLGTVLSNSARGLGTPTALNMDASTFDQIGKVGLGDLDIADDERTLYVVSLNEQKLYALNVPTGTLAGSYTIPDPGCTGGAWRPFATKFKNDALYVGGVCDAQTSQSKSDLQATIYRFTPGANTWTTVLTFPLTYPKGLAYNIGCPGITGWFAWTTTKPTPCLSATSNGVPVHVYVYPQPVLSDLEFDTDGSLLIGFLDRNGHQIGGGNGSEDLTAGAIEGAVVGGDLLRASNNNGTYVLESNGTAGAITGAGANNGQGPGGGEFYAGEFFSIYHLETVDGGLAFKPGSGEVAVSSMDPLQINSGGVKWLSNTTGNANRNYELYAPATPGSFAKANGIGDLELLVDPAPLEIGNRVWLDTDADGIQDPGEPPLVDVQVSRQGPTNTVTTLTDAEGRYYFSSLRANTTYTLTIDNPTGAFQLTTANANTATDNNAISDVRDNDATWVNNKATIVYTTGGPGENNHSLDFGFSDAPVYDLALIKTLAAGQAMTVAAGSPVTFTLVVKNQGDFNSGTFTVRDQLPTGLTYVSAAGTGFNACSQSSGVVTCVYPAAGINPGQTVTITLRATVESAINNAPYRNWAEISVDSGNDIDSTPDTNTGSDTGVGTGTAPNDAVIDHNDINHAGAAYDQTAEDEDDNDYQDLTAVYDLALIKTLAAGQPITVTPSSPVTFTLVIKNQGTGNSGTFTVRDQLPTGLTYVSASGAGFNACSQSSGVVTCVYPATGINAGQSVTLTLRATVEAVPANAPYRNWAEISADNGYDIDSTPDTNSGTDTGPGVGTAPNDAVIDHNDINHAGAAYDQTAEDEDDNDYQDLVVNYDLALIKTLGAGQAIKVAPGGQAEFTLLVKNQGNTNSGTFTVRDQLPTGLTYVSASGTGFNACSQSSGVVTCVYPATGINPGETAAITLRATVESVTTNAPYRNWAEISADTGYDIDSTPDTNSGSDTGAGTGTAPNDAVIDHNDIDHAGAAYDQSTEDEDDNDYQDLVPGVYDLALIKTLAPGRPMTVTSGATVTFTLTVKNQGDVDSGTFTVRDQLPTGLTYLTATGTNFTCTNASGVVTCPYTGNLASGESATLTIAATVETTPNNSPYRNWAEISVDSGADVDSTPDTNTGSDTGAGVGTNPNDPVIDHDDIDHSGAAYDERTEDEDDNDYQDVVVDYDLALIKTLAAGQVMTVTPGATVTFTLVVKNQGNTNSGTFTVRDQLPTGLTYVSASGTGFNACSQSSDVVTCVYPAAGITPGQTVTITLRATVEATPNNAPYRNWAEISIDSGNDIDSTPDTNSGTDTGAGLGTAPNDAVINHDDINHAGAAYDQTAEDEDDNDYQDLTVNYDLALIKTLAAGQVMTVTPGAPVTFTIVVKNQGGINSGTFTVRDQLPTGLTYVSAIGTGFNACTQSGGVVTCVYPAAGINPGQTVTITLRATVESAIINAPYRNWAEISADSGNDIDSTPDTNSGADTGVGVGTAPNDAVINHDDINHAGAAYDQPTEDEDDNDYQDLTAVYDLALIKTLAAGQVMTVTPGSPVTFTLVVKNQGTVNSGTFTVRDQLPTGLTYVSASGAGFNACTNASGVVTCVYPATGINPGQTVTITLRATVEATPNSNAPYRNWAEISVDSGYDIDSTPDTTSGTDTGAGLGTAPNDAVINHDDINHAGAAYDQTAEDEDDNDYQDIVVNYDLALIKTLAPGQVMTVTPGSPVTFTIVVKNQGGVNSGTFTVRDQLPTGLTYVSASGVGFNACTNSSGVVTCVYPAAGINPGQTVTITLRATVEATPNSNAPYRNWAEISADSGNDIDSTPDVTSGTDTGPGLGTNPNDAVINHDDINHAGAAYDQPTEDEDDNDYQDIVVNYDLALIKTLAPGQPAITPGAPVTFTIVVKNQGGVNSGTFTVRDQLPTGLTYVSATGTGFNACANSSGVVTCVYPAAGINPGQTVTLTLRATIETIPNNAPYRNWAEISVDSGNDIDSTPDTNSGTDTGPGLGANPNDAVINHDDINHAGATYDQPTEDEDDNDYQDVDIVYDLALIKTLASGQPLTVTGGSPVTFTVVVKNQGNTNSGTFTVRDQLPTGLTYVSATGAGFNACTQASGVVTCVYPATGITPGQTVTITLNATVEANGVNAPYRNWAEISVDSGGDQDSTPDTTTGTDTGVGVGTAPNDAVINHDDIDHAGGAYDQPTEDEDDNDYQDINVVYDLALIKTLAPGQLMPVAPGATVDFLLTVKNQGTAQSGAFTVRDQLPTGLTYVSATGTNFTCSVAGQVVTCNYTGNLAPGASVTLALRVGVESATTNAPYRNWAEISVDSGPDKDSTPDTTTGTDTGAGLGTNPNDAVINHDDIDHAGAAYDQTAEDEDDNDYQDVTVATTYDLALIKTLAASQPLTVTPGAPVAFTILVKNQGTLNSGAFTVRDQLPTGLTYVSASGSNFTCSASGQVVTCTYTGNLAQGATATITLNTRAESQINYAPYRNWAEISADSGNDIDSTPDTNTGQDASPGTGLSPNDAVINHDDIDHAGAAYDQRSEDEDDNDYAQVNVVTTVIDLALVKVATPTTLKAGDSVTYTLRIKNQGSVASGPYTVTDRLPTGFTFVAATNSGSHSSGVVTWSNLPSLAPNATQDLTLKATVPLTTAFGDYTNWAEISQDSGVDEDSAPDTNTGQDATPPNDPVIDRTSLSDVGIDMEAGDEDDNDPATVTVTAFDLALVKVASLTAVMPGQPVTFTLRVQNQSNIAADAFTVRDQLPTGATFVTASDGGSASSGVVTWSLSGLAAGASKDLTLVLTAPPSAGYHTNWAEISANGAPAGYVDQDSTPDTNTGHDATVPNDPVIDRTSLSDAAIDVEPGDEDDNDLARFLVPGDLPTGNGVLTVTKTVSGTGPSPFNVSVTGPSGYLTVTTVTTATPLVLTGLASGIYTVTEQAVGWTATYSATTGYSTGSRAVVTLTRSITTPATTAGAISGNVFRDFDADGVDDGTTEPGVAGLIVTAYDRNGVARGTATSDANGNYTINATGNGPYRLEFTNLSAGDEPSKQGSGNGSSTQFVTAPASNINFGINRPCDYCQVNPQMGVPNWYFFDPALGGNGTGNGGFTTFNFDGSGTPKLVAQDEQIGATWGVAYRRSTKTIFTAAFTREFVGYGPLGRGGIYTIDVSNANSPQVSSFVDLQTLGVDAGGTDPRAASVVNEIGKSSLGDIDISEDDKTLYIMNLYQRELVLLDIASKSVTKKVSVPNPGCASSTNVRPWAVDISNGNVYIGLVCSGENPSETLRAYVMRLNGNTFEPFFTFPLSVTQMTWQPWQAGTTSTLYIPLLADIEFDSSGALIPTVLNVVNFRRATGSYGTDTIARGNMFRFPNVNGQIAATPTIYYPTLYSGTSGHAQSTLSGSAIHLGLNLLTSAFLPGNNTNSVVRYNVAAGTMYQPSGSVTQYFIPISQGFEKGSGLGDLELLCDPAPLEIGNRVWNDLNGNGVQDPGEPGINGVQVSLQGPTNTVTVNTSGDGNYYFGNLRSGTSYTLTINPTQTALNGLGLTLANQQAISGSTISNDALLDTRDSDALLTNGTPVIFYTTGSAGQNNHGLDFGFTQPVSGRVTITNTALPKGTIVVRKTTVPVGSSQTFTVTSNVPGHASFTLRDGGSYTMTQVPIGTYMVTETLPSGWTQAAGTCNNVSTLGAIQVSKNLTTTCTILNALQPTMSNVLTVTKTVNWNGNTPNPGQTFAITITGPSFPRGKADTITAGQTKVYTNVVGGVYTVSETSPGAGWVTTYSVPSGVLNLSTAAITATTAGPISGNVFRDFDANGVDAGANEPGVAGVTVTAYDPNGVARGSATTDVNGNYSFTPTGNGPYRLELTNLPAGSYPTTHGSSNGTSTQFVTTNGGATNVNFGLNVPSDYCQSNPKVCTTVFANGLPSAGGYAHSVVSFDYNSSGDTPQEASVAAKTMTGSVWGLAYARNTRKVYSAAFVKRHTGLYENPAGTPHPGMIFVSNLTTGATTPFIDLATYGANVGTVPSNSTRGLGAFDGASADAAVFDLVGKAGLGDIDLSADEQTLWAVSLNDKKLFKITVDADNNPATAPAASDVTSYPIPNPGCNGGAWRPFAVKYYREAVYVGGMCDAQTSQQPTDLRAHIYQFNPTTGLFTTLFSTSALTYTRGYAAYACQSVTGWYAWASTFAQLANPWCYEAFGYLVHPQPLFTDIEFDVDGSLILGFADRGGHQGGSPNADTSGSGSYSYMVGGDILRACLNSSGAYVLESGGKCNGNGAGTASGTPEYYSGDFFLRTNSNTVRHSETSHGGLALKLGSGEVVVSAMDPLDGVDPEQSAGGVLYLNNTTGAKNRAFKVYINGETGTFGKSGGIGDVELLCDAAPLEIGNRVWNDLNGNGVQDPGEPGINGVQVSLQGPTTTITVNTSGDGNYYFGNLRASTAYTLTINPNQAPLSGLSLTQANMQAISGNPSSNDAILDTRDSDAVTVGGKATILYTTGSAGQNNHGLDFGFTQPLHGQVTIGNTAPPVGTIIIRKTTTPAGSSQTFSFASNVPGYTSFTLRDGESYTMSEVPVGTYAVTETLPSGWTQAANTCTNVSTLGAIQVSQNVTTTCTILNALQPTTSNVLTVTKTVNWNGNTPNPGQPFNITVTGPSFPNGLAATITAGQTKVYTDVVAGIYTVTETSPGTGWTTVYTATPGTGGNRQAVAILQQTNAATLPTIPITGTVFQDFNSDGLITANGVVTDTGVSNVTVTAYDKYGNNVGSATTANDGHYTINPTAAGPYRVEFSNLPSGYEPTAHNTGNRTSTQFVTTTAAASNVNLGILDPCDYCQDNPKLATTRMTGDDYSGYASTPALLTFSSSSVNGAALPFVANSGGSQNQFSQVAPMSTLTTLATQSQVGNIFGLAWQRNTGTLFSAAFGRANNMPNGGIGPSGLGAIYMTKGGVTTLFATVANVGTFGNADGNKVGTVGLGSLALAEDGNTLYAVNVFAHTLVSIPVLGSTPTAGTQTSTPLPVPADCPAANLHAFALGRNRDKLYVGLTCDGIGAANLMGYVYEYDGTTFTQKINLPFTYARPNDNANYYGSAGFANYQPNNLNFIDWGTYPAITDMSNTGSSPNTLAGFAITAKSQPWLTDIAFDKGDMVLGIRSRIGDARLNDFWNTGGDVVRACANSSTNPSTWTLENNGSCGGVTPPMPATDPYTGRSLASGFDSPTYGIGGRAYYWGNIGWESKPSAGALAQVPGYGVVYGVGVDIRSHSSEQGIMALNHRTGAIVGGGNVFYASNGVADTIAKGNGLGGLEPLCDPAPLEIGNRVWNDLNGNGVQDPGEPGINGVQVSLQGPTNTVTINTSGDGNYYFGDLRSNTAYTLTINPSQAPLSGLSLTQANLQAISGNPSSNDAILDTRDNDAVTVNGKATIFYTTGLAGQNNHGLDFGFTQPLSGKVDIANKAPRMDLGDNPDRYNTVITNTGAAHVIIPGLFLGASEDDEDDGQPTVDADGDGGDEDGVQFSTLKAGSTAIVTVTATNTGTQAAILAGWLDFNGNGQFEASERVTTTVPAGTTNGVFYLTYNIPADAVSATYARFRLSTDPTVINPTGVVADGEVEDYPITIQGVTLAQFGDRVWLESDRDGLAASGIITPVAGLLITATNGTQIHVTTTNSQGYYSFTVDAGTYTVTYGTVPGNYGVVLPSSTPGGNQESGSAGSYREVGKPDQSHANHSTVTLTPGQANWQLDFAFHAPQVDLHLVKQVTPKVAASGGPQTYTLVLTNDGPDPATGVQVRDRLPSSMIYQSATAQQGAYDANTGIWDIGTVAAGSSVTLTITVTLK